MDANVIHKQMSLGCYIYSKMESIMGSALGVFVLGSEVPILLESLVN